MPLWFAAIIDALIIFAVPWIIGFVVHLSRIKAQSLPEHRIEMTERLALQAAKSIAPFAEMEARRDAADIALLELCKEYDVAVPGKKAREHCLNSAFFDIGG